MHSGPVYDLVVLLRRSTLSLYLCLVARLLMLL
jgi:hypothetical protein